MNEYHVFRLCAWENIHAPKNECVNIKTPSYIKTEFCETCDTDGWLFFLILFFEIRLNPTLYLILGCNGAVQYRPVAVLVLTILVVTAKIILF